MSKIRRLNVLNPPQAAENPLTDAKLLVWDTRTLFGLAGGSKVLIATSGSIDATLKAVLLLLLLIADVVNATDEIIGAPLVAALLVIPPSSSWSAQCTETVSSSRANAMKPF